MKVLLLNGSPHEKGCTYTALNEIAETLVKNGVEAEIYHIGTKPIAGCIACNSCAKTGKCVFNDDGVNEIASRLDEFDGIVLGAPVYYAGAAGQAHAFFDRLFYFNGRKMAGKLGAAVVSCRRGGATAAWDNLNKYFGMNNMITVGSQYWNQIHGNNAEEAKQDTEGLQTMRTLAQNMAWLLKSIDAGRKAGIEYPTHETPTYMNFIR